MNKEIKLKLTIKNFFYFLKQDKLILIFLFTFSMLAAAAIISASFFVGNTLNRFVGALANDGSISSTEILDVLYTALLTLLLYLAHYLFNTFIFIGATKLSYRSGSKIRTAVFTKILSISIKDLDQYKIGELMSRSTSDVDIMINNMVQFMVQWTISPALIIASLTSIFIVSSFLALVAITLIAIIFTIMFLIAKNAGPNFNKTQNQIGKLNAVNEEFLTNHFATYLYGAQNYAIHKFQPINAEHQYQSYQSEYKIGMIYPALDIMENISYGILFTIGYLFIMLNVPQSGPWALNDGLLATFILLTRTANSEFGNLARFASITEKLVACLKRIFEIIGIEDDHNEGKIALDKLQGAIEFKNVNFAYEANKPVLKDFNLKINAGQKVAIVGPTGSGKSTVINLLMRFYDPNAGQIYIDGIAINDIEKNNLRKFISVVLQDSALFSESVLTNIAYGHQGKIDKEQIKYSAQEIGANHFINLLANDYETILDENNDISSGEAQLLALTRAHYSPANILILDEATSNIDSKTEYDVQQGMLRLMKNKTSIIIAHRLSTIINADLIVVMQNGRIIEKGNHVNLLAKQGFYYNLYHKKMLEYEAE